jgi:hypothetical protein
LKNIKIGNGVLWEFGTGKRGEQDQWKEVEVGEGDNTVRELYVFITWK